MNMPALRISTICLLSAGLLTSVALAQGAKTEKAVTLKSLPAAVQRTAREQSKGATIRGISRELGEDGKPVYEIEMKVNGSGKDLIIAADGTLLIKEQEIAMASLPPAVRATIEKNAGKRKIMLVETVSMSDTLAYYEAQVRAMKVVSEIKVAPDGRLIKK